MIKTRKKCPQELNPYVFFYFGFHFHFLPQEFQPIWGQHAMSGSGDWVTPLQLLLSPLTTLLLQIPQSRYTMQAKFLGQSLCKNTILWIQVMSSAQCAVWVVQRPCDILAVAVKTLSQGKTIFLRLFFLCSFRKKTWKLVSLFIFRR